MWIRKVLTTNWLKGLSILSAARPVVELSRPNCVFSHVFCIERLAQDGDSATPLPPASVPEAHIE